MPPNSQVSQLAQGTLGIAPISTVPATVNGTGIDRLAAPNQGFRGCKLTGIVGAASGGPSAQSVIYQLQDSADDITYADFGAAIPAMITDDAVDSVNIDIGPARRYLRTQAVVALTAGASPEQVICAVMTLTGPRTAPTAD